MLGIRSYTFYFFALFFVPSVLYADIVKPTLVEISVSTDGKYSIEIRASIEALLTGINSQYTNTKESPNAQAYDDLRVLSPEQLQQKFSAFHQQFTQVIGLKFDGKPIRLHIASVKIPEPGYTKIPRMSVVILSGKIDRKINQISWYYPAKFADNAVRVRQINKTEEKWHWSNWQWLKNDQWSDPFKVDQVFHKQPSWGIISDYTQAGFAHILPKGFDHILFILGIFLLSTKWRPLIWQVTMFTVAHSLTLTLAMLDVFSLPSNIVEPLIALSIAYVGIENILVKKINPSRLAVVFVFGLLHGMGFASMLTDFGMPNGDFTLALIFFNIGVELGQLSILALAFVFVAYWLRDKSWYRNIIIIPASLTISLIGLYWTWDRLVF